MMRNGDLTFSVTVRGVELRKLGKSLKAAYPRRLDCRDIIEIQPAGEYISMC
jgi:hypothetical protein